MVESFVIGYLFLQLDIATVFSGLKASLRRKVIICFPHTRKKRYSIWNLLSWVARIAPQSSNNIRLPQSIWGGSTCLAALQQTGNVLVNIAASWGEGGLVVIHGWIELGKSNEWMKENLRMRTILVIIAASRGDGGLVVIHGDGQS